MNNCTYTGAQVFLNELGCVVAADLYDQGAFIVIRFTPNSQDWSEEARARITHRVTLSSRAWHHDVAGVTVITRESITGNLVR